MISAFNTETILLIQSYLLVLLLFLSGFDIGRKKQFFKDIKLLVTSGVTISFVILVGTLVGGAIASFFINLSIPEALSVSSGMGFYSVSGIILTQVSPTLGILAFLTNAAREILTILLTPFLAKLNKLFPIAAGAATSLDSTFPIIAKFNSEEGKIISIISGLILTISVPFLVSFFGGMI